MSLPLTAIGLSGSRSHLVRTMVIVCAVAVLIVPATLAAIPLSLILVMGSDAVHSFGGACAGPAPRVKAGQSVDGYGEDQLKIAAVILSTGQARAIDRHGQQIALMVAMGESSLQDLDHGDAVDNSTIGVFQQGASYGTRPQRMDVATAAAAFYTRMVAVPGWESMDPSALGHRVQINADPDHYTPYYTPAGDVIAALTGQTDSACAVPADARQAATLLVAAIGAGKLTFLESRYQQQVMDMANGTATPNCSLDAHVLQVIVIAVNNFQQVGVSDLNRRCTGSTPGAGTASAHWSGKAVDFYALNRRSLTGSDQLTLQLIQILDPYVPRGSELGQANCRAAAGDSVRGLQNFTSQFSDSCDHQHVQVP